MRAAAEEDEGKLLGVAMKVKNPQQRQGVIARLDLRVQLHRELRQGAGHESSAGLNMHIDSAEPFMRWQAQLLQDMRLLLTQNAPPSEGPSAEEASSWMCARTRWTPGAGQGRPK